MLLRNSCHYLQTRQSQAPTRLAGKPQTLSFRGRRPAGANSHSPGRVLRPQNGELFRLIPKASCNRVIRGERERGNSRIRKLCLSLPQLGPWHVTVFFLLLRLKKRKRKSKSLHDKTGLLLQKCSSLKRKLETGSTCGHRISYLIECIERSLSGTPK